MHTGGCTMPAWPGFAHVYSGKVRDLYAGPDGRLLFVASDRISAYDHVLPTTIPDKGRVLTQLSLWWFEQLADLVPNHVVSLDVPAERRGRAMVCERLSMYPVECVARGYLGRLGAGSTTRAPARSAASRCRRAGRRVAGCPSRCSRRRRRRPSGSTTRTSTSTTSPPPSAAAAAERAARSTLAVYARAEEIARPRAVIVADTKLELGAREDGTMVLADEVLTPDSSRFWPADGWEPGHPQPSYDKQFVRDWLTSPASGWDRASGERTAAAARRRRRADARAVRAGVRAADREDVHVTWLVTGGAGYIGAHVARALEDRGLPVVVLDDLSSGHGAFVRAGTAFVEGSVTDPATVRAALVDNGCTGVVHLAGFKYAGVSVERPPAHVHAERHGHQVLLAADGRPRRPAAGVLLVGRGVRHAGRRTWSPNGPRPAGVAVRGDQARQRVADPRRGQGGPAAAHSLRYFNVVGSGSPDLYDTSPHNLFPLVLKALTEGRTPVVRGDRLPDAGRVVRARLRTRLRRRRRARRRGGGARAGRSRRAGVQPGSGEGVSVLQIMAAMARVTGIDFAPRSPTAVPATPPASWLRRAGRAGPGLGHPAFARRLRRVGMGVLARASPPRTGDPRASR